MAVLKIKDANGNWQNIVALKGDQGERGPEGPVGPAGGVNSVNGMTGDVTIASYSLPTASSNTLGGVKVGSNITNSSGTISLTKANITNALGYTPLSTSGTAAKATKLATPRTITLTGDATGSVSFDGSKNVELDVTVSGGGGDYLPTNGGALTGTLQFNQDSSWATDIIGDGTLIMAASSNPTASGFMATESAVGLVCGGVGATLTVDGVFKVGSKQVALLEEVPTVTYGETDLDAGVSTLATGSIYLMYE